MEAITQGQFRWLNPLWQGGLGALILSGLLQAAEVTVTGAASLLGNRKGEIQLELKEKTGRATVRFDYTRGLDVSRFRDVAVRIDNKSSAELDVWMSGVSDLDFGWRYGTDGRFLVRAGEQLDLQVLMTREPLPADHPYVKRLGNLYSFPWGYQRHWRSMDVSSVKRVRVQLNWQNAKKGSTITVTEPFGVESYSVDPAKLDSLDFPLVDRFGQLRSQEWSGKLKLEAELREDAVKDLAKAERFAKPGEGLTRFGGWANGPTLEATGFFRVEKVKGRWWFVDPEGKLFWSLGVNTTGNSVETLIKGREELFPVEDRGRKTIRYYEENLKRKYGEEGWKEAHVGVTVGRMQEWGLNTVGAWSIPEMAATRRVPYTLMVHTRLQRLGGISKIPDPYGAVFKQALNERLANFAAEHAQSPWLLGVFIHNELHWGAETDLVKEIIKSPGATPARQALMSFLRKKYGNVTGLNKAWHTEYDTFWSMKPGAGPKGRKQYDEDLQAFLEAFADRYFSLCREAMDTHFPNQLYLGCRFHVLNPSVTRAASRYCDVMSANVYRHRVAGFKMETDADRPFMVSEFHFGVRDYGNWGVGLTWAADARNQADLLQVYLSEALKHPNLVGAHWFMWSNQIVTGRSDGENFGVGLVSVVDRPLPTLLEAFQSVSDAMYPYRQQAPPLRLGAP